MTRQSKRKSTISLWESALVLATLMIITEQAQFCNTTSNNITTCYPCYYRCKDCSGVTQRDCTSCLQEFILVNQTCQSCGDNCFSCKNITDTSNLNSQNIQSQCQTCIEGYYLSQSTGKCIKCPTGVKACTLSALQSCQSGYYESNGVCFKCQQNCVSCLSSTQCQSCQNYFYLNSVSGNCQNCSVPHCMVCDGSSTCISCEDGYSGSSCSEICPENCGICYSGICYVCKDNFYMSNGSCLPAGLLCKFSSSFGQCDQCFSDLAYLSDTQSCIPLFTVHDENRLLYLTGINNFASFSTISPYITSNISDSKSLAQCQSSTFMVKSLTKTVYVSIKIEPSYKISVKSQLLSSSQSFQLSVYLNSSMLSSSNQTLSTSYGKICNNQTYYLFNHRFEFDFTGNFNSTKDLLVLQFNIQTASNFSSLGLTEIYFELFRCQMPNCLMCKSAYTCQTCIYPFRLQNNECLKTCEEGYYLTETPSSFTCTLDCFKGYFAVRQDYTCQKCQWPCLQCEDLNECTKCYHFDNTSSTLASNQTFFLFDNVCVQQCPSKYFPDLETYQCEECVFPCSECSSLTSCNSCQMGYLNQAISKCAVQCPQGQYADFIELKCEPCSNPCSLCYYSPSTCTQCISPFYLFQNNNTCLTSCPKDYAQITGTTNYCVQCDFPCKTCFNLSSNCTSCLKGYFYNGTCVSQCPSQFYSETTSDLNNVCSPCTNNCLQCQDQNVCLSCMNDFWYNVRQKSCVLTCPKGTYTDSYNVSAVQIQKRCLQCIPPCLDCTNSTYCLSCTGLLFLNHLGQCLLECPRGTYIYYNSTIEERQCMQCLSNCLSCVSTTNCYECKDGWLLWEGLCYTVCPDETFSNQNGYKYCESCYYPCLTCRNEYQCMSCVSGFLYQVDLNKCVEFCVDGYFENVTDSTCLKCNVECETCIDTAENCLSCALGYFYNAQKQKCTSDCPVGTYYSASERKCRQCQWPCKTCESFTACTSCYQINESLPLNLSLTNSTPQYILYLNHCIGECPEGYFQTQINSTIITCQKCQFPCEQCSLSQNNCTKCRIPSISYYETTTSLNGTNTSTLQCLSSCPAGYYLQGQECEFCQQPCKECLSSSYCTLCITGWYLVEGLCYQVCPYHSFPTIVNNISICAPCSDQCRQCVGNQTNCTECTNNQYLLSPSVCVTQCPTLFYPSSSTMRCLPCETPCLDCYSKKYCKTCKSGYLMQVSKCVLSCDSKYYLKTPNATVCTPCEYPCEKCQSAVQCLSCVSGYFYLDYNFSCVKQCPSKMYGYQTEVFSSSASNQTFKGVCLQCSQLCQECSSYSVCLSCNESSDLKFLQQSKCQTNCSEGYFYRQDMRAFYPHNCYKCKQNCISCISQTTCLKCLSSYLYQNQCLKTCPPLYYASMFFTCETCIFPCYECYNEYSCVNCVEGYFLYKNICVKRCPSTHWTDLQLRQCVTTCSKNKFLNEANKTCLLNCQYFYSSDSYCLDTCQNSTIQFSFINSTLGCQTCQYQNQQICSEIQDKLKFKLEYIVLNGKLLLVFKFATLMKFNSDHLNQTQADANITSSLGSYFNFSLQKKQFIHQELNINFMTSSSKITFNPTNFNVTQSISVSEFNQIAQNESRYLQMLEVQSNGSSVTNFSNNFTVFYGFLPNSLWLQINYLPQNIDAFSGFLNYQIQSYLSLVSQSLFQLSENGNQQYFPFQEINLKQTELKSFSPSRKIPEWMIESNEILANIFSYTILVLIIINLLTDNLKSLFHIIDFTQNLFLLLWIGNNLELGIFSFFKGFSIISFIFDFQSKSSSQDFLTLVQNLSSTQLWNCSPKQLIYGNSCQFAKSFINIGVFVVSFIVIILVMKFIAYVKPIFDTHLKIHHKVFYNHINNFYWLFVSPIFYLSSSQFFMQNQSQIFFNLDIFLMVVCGFLTLLLGYQLLKNIFNCSFEEKTFFWGLKCHKMQNTQANIHFLLIMIRKSIFMLAVALSQKTQQKQLVYLFLVVLVSVIILSNVLANSPFKKKWYQVVLVICEILGILFYLGIEIYIVNVKKFDSETYLAYNLLLLVTAVVIIILHLIVSITETFKNIKSKYQKYKKIEGNENNEEETSSYDSDQKSSKDKLKNKDQLSSNKSQKGFTLLPAELSKNNKERKKTQNGANSGRGMSSNADAQTKGEKAIRDSQKNEKESSSLFSDLKSEQHNTEEFEEPAKYLIKLEKNPKSRQQSSEGHSKKSL